MTATFVGVPWHQVLKGAHVVSRRISCSAAPRLEEIGVGEVAAHGQSRNGKMARAGRPIGDEAVAAKRIWPQRWETKAKEGGK